MRARRPSRRTALAARSVLIACLAILVSVPLLGWVRQERAARPLGSRPVLAGSATTQAAGTGAAPARTRGPAAARRSSSTPPAAPARLALERLGIDVPVDPVGVAADGTMALPDDGFRVGWYRFGPTPGSPAGSAVLAGHVDTREQGRGALFPLSRAVPGDSVVVRRTAGPALRYTVVSRELLPRAELPVAELFGETGPARLTLLTCGGAYVRGRGYTDNVVVTALPVTSPPQR
jgi:hypothetical protein